MAHGWNIVLDELGAAAVVAVLVVALLLVCELLRRAGAPVEVTRKTAHIGSGLVAWSFPFFFESPLTVLLLAFSFFVLLTAGKLLGTFRGVHGVQRQSVGAYVFPAVVALLFWLADGDAVLYQIPILVLAFSDAIAALIGKGYGKASFHAVGEQRTIEGSAAFFVATFIAVHVPLLLSGQTHRLESVLIAALTAALVTGFEALSVKGLDNLFVPLGTYVVLSHAINDTAEAHCERLVLIAAFASVGGLFCRLRVMTSTGAVGLALATYGAYKLGGPAWFWPLPALYLLLLLAGLWLKRREPTTPPLGLSAVFHTCISAVVLYFLHDHTRVPLLYVGYLAAITAGTAALIATLVARARSRQTEPSRCVPRLAVGLGLGVAIATLAPLPVLALVGLPPGIAWLHVLLGVAGSFVAVPVIVALAHTTALFECPECGAIAEVSRHCGQPGAVRWGRRVWTRNRLAMTAITASAALALGVGGLLPPEPPATAPARPLATSARLRAHSSGGAHVSRDDIDAGRAHKTDTHDPAAATHPR